MKTYFRLCILIVMLILLLLVGVRITQAQRNQDSYTPHHTNSQANFPWITHYVQQQLDPPRDVGGYVSIALIPINDFLVISYYDATNHSLMVASPFASNGNCGTNNKWMCITLDGGGGYNVGTYTSIDMWGYSVDNWKMGISYYDATNRSLKAAIYTCNMGSCGWEKVTVNAPISQNKSNGLFSSFKFDSTGNASIAYFSFNSTYSDSVLMYVYQVPGGGDCGEGSSAGLWECDEAYILGGEGKYASLDFSYNDVPYIAFYNAHEGDLKVVYKGGMCGVELGWSCLNIDGYDGSDVGAFVSLIAPQSSSGPIRIAYLDKTLGHLKYYDSSWGRIVVDEMGTSDSPKGISMLIDDNGFPVIAYQYIASEFSPPALRIARPYAAYDDGKYGNCGDIPGGYFVQYWRCLTLDNGGQYSEEADFASLVINSAGMVGIAYSEYDSYYDVTSLKFIYQTLFRTFLPVTTRH